MWSISKSLRGRDAIRRCDFLQSDFVSAGYAGSGGLKHVRNRKGARASSRLNPVHSRSSRRNGYARCLMGSAMRADRGKDQGEGTLLHCILMGVAAGIRGRRGSGSFCWMRMGETFSRAGGVFGRRYSIICVEYTALVRGLTAAKALKASKVIIKADSASWWCGRSMGFTR